MEKDTERPLALKYTTCFLSLWLNATEITLHPLQTHYTDSGLYMHGHTHIHTHSGVFQAFPALLSDKSCTSCPEEKSGM